jgi:serine/threonine-protein kinase
MDRAGGLSRVVDQARNVMSPERWQQIKTILDAAAGYPAGGRQAAVEDACREDSALLHEVESFLELDDEVEDFIEEPLWTLNPAADQEPRERLDWASGRRIGPYRIERPLGRGGMGTVFLACREDAYQQKVAIKVLSWGMSSEEVQARFYNERQILANLQHPGIARLLDGGTTDDGLPYLVMEYVEGERIDRYCERRQLSVRETLELFRGVCAAVHFAHQNLIVHRDLKASNILVTEEGKPRLLDFGIAKLLEPQLAFQTVATMPGRSPMTPAYASPEQVLNDPITTAADVYALGVLLYRLLTGLPPYRLKGTGYAEMVQVICYHEPEKPSTIIRLDDLRLDRETTEAAAPPAPEEAASGKPEPGVARRGLQRKIAGDLDAIVLKAMRKEPQHRYASAAEMSEDIRRHLVGLPVEARKGNWLYHTTKYLRRNKLALAAILMIVAFAVTTTVLWREAVQERAQAVDARERAVRISDFLENIFRSAEPDQARGEDVTVMQVLEQAEARLEEDLESEPVDRADMADTLSSVYGALGSYERARKLAEETVQILREANPQDHRDLASAINNVGSVLYKEERYEEAEEKFRESLEMRRRLGQSAQEVATIVSNVASTRLQLGRYDDAEHFIGQLVDVDQLVKDPSASANSTYLYILGTICAYRGDYEQAEPLLRRALDLRLQGDDPESTQVAEVLSSLGRTLLGRGELEEAESYYRRALAIRARRYKGEDNVHVARTKTGLAALFLARGDAEAAEKLVSEALEVLAGADGSRIGFARADARSVWGGCLVALGRYDEAEPILLDSYQTIRDIHGDGSSFTRVARKRVVDLYEAWGKPAEAWRLEPNEERGS